MNKQTTETPLTLKPGDLFVVKSISGLHMQNLVFVDGQHWIRSRLIKCGTVCLLIDAKRCYCVFEPDNTYFEIRCLVQSLVVSFEISGSQLSYIAAV